MKQKRELFACGLWVAAVALLVFGTIDSIQRHRNEPLLAWGLFVALVALVPTGWCLLERICQRDDDTTITRVIEVVDALHDGRENVSRLH